MRVQLAYPFEEHEPDEIIEVSNNLGRRLLNQGRARTAPPMPAIRVPPKKPRTPRVKPPTVKAAPEEEWPFSLGKAKDQESEVAES